MRSKWVALTGVVLVVTAGCSVYPGAAAVVDGDEISEVYLQGAVEDFADLGDVTDAQVLNVLVAMRAGEAVAVDRGISVSGEDALAELEDAGIDTSEFSAGGVELARYIAMVSQTEGREDVEEINAEMDAARRAATVEVNPRYGVFDSEAGSIVDVAPAWIVTDVPAEQEPTGQ